jgi:hypothetical protein
MKSSEASARAISTRGRRSIAVGRTRPPRPTPTPLKTTLTPTTPPPPGRPPTGSRSLFVALDSAVSALQLAGSLVKQCSKTPPGSVWPVEDAVEFQSVAAELLAAVSGALARPQPAAAPPKLRQRPSQTRPPPPDCCCAARTCITALPRPRAALCHRPGPALTPTHPYRPAPPRRAAAVGHPRGPAPLPCAVPEPAVHVRPPPPPLCVPPSLWPHLPLVVPVGSAAAPTATRGVLAGARVLAGLACVAHRPDSRLHARPAGPES